MNKKEFRTLDEQIEILKSKGLTIDNEEKVKDILFRENYFFVNGYRTLFFDKNRKFFKGPLRKAWSFIICKEIVFSIAIDVEKL